MRRGRGGWSLLLGAVLGLLGAGPASQGNDRTMEIVAVEIVDAMPVGPGVEERLAEIRRRIQDAALYPPLARRRGLEGVARVRFAIAPDGQPRDVELARSSGHFLLDRAARRAVWDAGRLPWVQGRLEVPVRFALRDPG